MILDIVLDHSEQVYSIKYSKQWKDDLTRAPWADNKLYKVADSSAQVSFICLVERLIPFCVILLNEVQVPGMFK